jgi:hypothetical protein
MINLVRLADGGIESFKTANHTYTFLKPGSPISVKRWTEYERLNIMFGFNRTFGQIYEAIDNLGKAAAADKPFADIRTELILGLSALKAGIVDESKTRYNHAFYLATIFTLQDDQKLSDWSFERAGEIIKDWQENEVNEQDLFFFALNVSSGIKAVLKHEREQVRERTELLSGLIGSKKGSTSSTP